MSHNLVALIVDFPRHMQTVDADRTTWKLA